ncbi:MAG: ABC transporter permease [Azospirillaceae bacterium]
MFRRIRALIVKELLAILNDPKSRAILVVLPLVQLGVFPFAATFEVDSIRIAVWNPDGGVASRDLVARFAGAPVFHPVVAIDGRPAIEAALPAREADLVIVIDQRFSADVAAGRPAAIQLLVDGSNSNTALVTLSYAREIVRDHAAAIGPDPPARLATRALYNPNLESAWFILPGLLGILTTIASLAVTAFSVAREKETGTFQQLLVTPLRPAEILVGKMVPGLVIGLAQGAVIVAVMHGVYGVPLAGSLALLAGALAVFLTSVIGIGLAVSAIARTQQQALFGAFLFTVPMVILSGFATPVENMPGWIRTLTLGNPLRWFMEIARGVVLKDLPPAAVLNLTWPMALIAVVTLTVAALVFRRRAG